MTSTITATHTSAPIRTEVATLWRLSWPMLVGQLATVGMGVADVAMTGHVSAAELAAGRFGKISHAVRESLWMGAIVGVFGCIAANLCTLLFDHIGLEAAVA